MIIFPDPVFGLLSFSEMLYDIEIFNTFGQVVAPEINIAGNISVIQLTDGLYFIQSKTPFKINCKKVTGQPVK